MENILLGKYVFLSRFSEQMVTKMCQKERKASPFLPPSSTDSAKDKRHSIENSMELSAHSLHNLLLVIPIGHYLKRTEK